MADALRANGYYSLSHVYFYLRDKDHFIPRELPFHVMPIEVDYGYT
jgi:hypothetical protein